MCACVKEAVDLQSRRGNESELPGGAEAEETDRNSTFERTLFVVRDPWVKALSGEGGVRWRARRGSGRRRTFRREGKRAGRSRLVS